MKSAVFVLAAAWWLSIFPSPADATETAEQVEHRFDRSGDGVVDAEDWKRLSADEQRDYVQAFLGAFSAPGEPVDSHRVQLYLQALNALYHFG